jgi:uncharacterized Tic20 family protein
MSNLNRSKLLSALCHGSVFFSSLIFSVAIPLVILYTTNNSVVRANAKESLNFHINFYIYSFFIGLLFLLVFFYSWWVNPFWHNALNIILYLMIGLGIVTYIMAIMALIKVLSNPSQPYRYPLIFRLI